MISSLRSEFPASLCRSSVSDEIVVCRKVSHNYFKGSREMFAHRKKPIRRSPLKAPPLRNPGQSLDKEIRRLLVEDFTYYIYMAGVFVVIVLTEGIRWLNNSPPAPILYTLVAAPVIIYAGRKAFLAKRKIRNLELGREGEKAVGQYLDKLREEGYQVFHDIVADGFNLDHVLIGPSGVFAIETKTISKPSNREAVVQYDGEKVTVAGFEPDRDPVQQVKASASWPTFCPWAIRVSMSVAC